MGEITPGETVIDAAVQYAQHIPVNVIGRMLGFPAEDEELFRKFVHDVARAHHRGTRDHATAIDDLGNYILAQIARSPRATRATTSPSYLLNVEIEGNKLVTDDIVGGIDHPAARSPGSTPPGRRSARRCGTSPSIPTTASGCSTIPR